MSAKLLPASIPNPNNPKATPTRCTDSNFTITADDQYELYFDGAKVTSRLPNANKWEEADTVWIPASARVIAIKAVDTGSVAGILASGADATTNGSWKCTSTFQNGWTAVNFNDSAWPNATVIGNHGVSPWGNIAGISSDAKWIWTPNHVYGPTSDKTVYCRKRRTQDLTTAGWSPRRTGVTYQRHQLQSSDPEYQAVIQNMTNNGGSAYTSKVLEINRIENYSLYNVFKSCKAELDRDNGQGFQSERMLWHGTHVDVLGNIYRGGFNRSYCGRNAIAFGEGVYFATQFSYSAGNTYSPPDAKAQKYIFQCRVLTGHFSKGRHGLKEPPMRTRELRYDSVVDNMTKPSMYVIFKDMHVYPEYVITLKA